MFKIILKRVNQKIKTGLGVAIIIIFAVTFGVFVWKAINVNNAGEKDDVNPEIVLPKKLTENLSKETAISFDPSNEVNNCEKDWKTPSVYKVLVNGKEIGNVQKEGCNTKIRFIGKNSDFAYFEIQPVGIGGYIVTNIGYFDVYQINLAKNIIQKMEKGIDAFDKDFRKIIVNDVEKRKVILKEISSGIEKNIKIPAEYNPGENQLGDFFFSPNMEKIAMKFVYGMPGEEICEIYSYDVKSDTLNLYKKIDYLISVDGWKNNEEISWKKF